MKKIHRWFKELFKIVGYDYGLNFDFSTEKYLNEVKSKVDSSNKQMVGVPSNNTGNMSTIIINDKSFTTKGNNISVIDDKVMVDGVVIESGLSGIVKIQFEGDLASLDANVVEITGNVIGKVDSNTLKVTGDIRGNVDGTTVTCKDIYGSVDAVVVHGNIKK